MDNKIVVVSKGILLSGGKALVLRRDDNDEIGGGTWEFPGGNIEFGESPEEALKREYLEETGLEVEIEKLLYVTSFKTHPNRQVLLIAYLCRCSDSTALRLSCEHSEYKWAGREELQKCLSEGIAQDIGRNNLWEIFS